MLNPTDAPRLLKQWQVEDLERNSLVYAPDPQNILTRIKKLPPRLRNIGFAIFGSDEDDELQKRNEETERKETELRLQAALWIDRASAKDRTTFFEACVPGWSRELGDTWKLLTKAPYSENFHYSFRSPDHPEHSAMKRADWLEQFSLMLDNVQTKKIDAGWLAAWAPYLPLYSSDFFAGPLLAAVLDRQDRKGDEVLQILKDSASNQHEIGRMGSHVSIALLYSSRQEGWDFIKQLLIAARRQEGLRQSILQFVKQGHPDAFRQFARLIVDEGLIRFSSVVREIDLWFGLAWDSASASIVQRTIANALDYLEDPRSRKKALAGPDAEQLYLALWAAAFENAPAAIEIARTLLTDKQVDKRFAVVCFLCKVGLPESLEILPLALSDSDLRVVAMALVGIQAGIRTMPYDWHHPLPEMFDRVTDLLERLPPKPTKLKPLVWPWMQQQIDPQYVASLLVHYLDDRPASRLIPYLQKMPTPSRVAAIEKIGGQKKFDTESRQTLIQFCTDPSTIVRESAIAAIAKVKLVPEEALVFERAFTRKSPEVRRALFKLLLTLPDQEVLYSAQRLIDSSNGLQRIGGLELLRLMVESKRQISSCQEIAQTFLQTHKRLSKDEEKSLQAIASSQTSELTLENGLGLMDPSRLTPRRDPVNRKVLLFTPASFALLESLDNLIHKHRDQPLAGTSPLYKNDERLLGEATWGFISVYEKGQEVRKKENLPLLDIWEEWYANRPRTLRDPDGYELVRAKVIFSSDLLDAETWKEAAKFSPEFTRMKDKILPKGKLPRLRYTYLIKDLLDWLLFLHPAQNEIDFLLDAAETSFAQVLPEKLKEIRPTKVRSSLRAIHWGSLPMWNEIGPLWGWIQTASEWLEESPKEWSTSQTVRLWRLHHWANFPQPGAERKRPDHKLLHTAFKAGEANEHDLIDSLIGPRTWESSEPLADDLLNDTQFARSYFPHLSELTEHNIRNPCNTEIVRDPRVASILDRCRARVLEIELARGDSPTLATQPALNIKSFHGLSTLIRILTELGKTKLKNRRYVWEGVNESRPAVLTHLLKQTFPADGDSPEAFKRAIAPLRKEGLLDDQRLAELAFVALQWLPHVEFALGWKGFSEGVLWYLAHMSRADTSGIDAEPNPDDEKTDLPEWQRPSPFERLIAKRTPLTESQRDEGAIDVVWFRRTYAEIGKARWEILAAAGRYASTTQQAAKAQFIGDVILGRASKTQLIADIRKKKLKNQVRLLGLFPLPTGPALQKELLSRYQVLQEYQQYAKGLSSMSKPGALRAVEIGLANLASTAGYPDTLRMSWALEAAGLADLNRGPVSVQHEGVTVTLSLDDDAHPLLTYSKAGKALKSLTPALRKNKKIAELVERNTELKRQTSRVRQSLETMMWRGDLFSAAELLQLAEHPLIWPLLSRLIVVGDNITGYPDKQGRALRNYVGKFEPIRKNESLRIAHPHDLLLGKHWHEWQHECFRAERVQPIKQIFRELYIVTKQEKSDGPISRRYAGQQINPSQAFALFGQRGWRTADGVEKTFYESQITAAVDFLGGWGSPTDVEGLTLETLSFFKQDELKPLPLKDVPPIIFSEVMRDLDLVVSVAHRGNVDPEASASTIEMRSALLQETCSLSDSRTFG